VDTLFEPVVMHADVRHMARHRLDRLAPPDLQKLLIARGVELQDGRADWNPCVHSVQPREVYFPFTVNTRRAVGRLPGFLDAPDFLRRQLETRSIFGRSFFGVRLGSILCHDSIQ